MNKKLVILKLIIIYSIGYFSPIMGQDQGKKQNSKTEKSSKDAPVKVTTPSGDEVILNSDGTWEYAANLKKRTVNNTKFVIPAASKDFVKGNDISYQVFYDKAKWVILEKNISEIAEFSFQHSDDNAYAMIVAENEAIPLDDLRNIVLDNIKAVAKNVKIINEEERTVNGSKVIMLNVKAIIQGMDFVYHYYIYSGEGASIQVVSFTSEDLYLEHKTDMENLLNGFVMKK